MGLLSSLPSLFPPAFFLSALPFPAITPPLPIHPLRQGPGGPGPGSGYIASHIFRSYHVYCSPHFWTTVQSKSYPVCVNFASLFNPKFIFRSISCEKNPSYCRGGCKPFICPPPTHQTWIRHCQYY